MMITTLLISWMHIMTWGAMTAPAHVSEAGVSQLRSWFAQSADSEEACRQLLNASAIGASVEHQGYHAVAHMMNARYLINPLDKLRSFNRGRNALDRLIQKHPRHLELRWLRHCVQQQAPSMLNYQQHMVEDVRVIRAVLKRTPDQALRDFILEQDRRRNAWY